MELSVCITQRCLARTKLGLGLGACSAGDIHGLINNYNSIIVPVKHIAYCIEI